MDVVRKLFPISLFRHGNFSGASDFTANLDFVNASDVKSEVGTWSPQWAPEWSSRWTNRITKSLNEDMDLQPWKAILSEFANGTLTAADGSTRYFSQLSPRSPILCDSVLYTTHPWKVNDLQLDAFREGWVRGVEKKSCEKICFFRVNIERQENHSTYSKLPATLWGLRSPKTAWALVDRYRAGLALMALEALQILKPQPPLLAPIPSPDDNADDKLDTGSVSLSKCERSSSEGEITAKRRRPLWYLYVDSDTLIMRPDMGIRALVERAESASRAFTTEDLDCLLARASRKVRSSQGVADSLESFPDSRIRQALASKQDELGQGLLKEELEAYLTLNSTQKAQVQANFYQRFEAGCRVRNQRRMMDLQTHEHDLNIRTHADIDATTTSLPATREVPSLIVALSDRARSGCHVQSGAILFRLATETGVLFDALRKAPAYKIATTGSCGGDQPIWNWLLTSLYGFDFDAHTLMQSNVNRIFTRGCRSNQQFMFHRTLDSTYEEWGSHPLLDHLKFFWGDFEKPKNLLSPRSLPSPPSSSLDSVAIGLASSKSNETASGGYEKDFLPFSSGPSSDGISGGVALVCLNWFNSPSCAQRQREPHNFICGESFLFHFFCSRKSDWKDPQSFAGNLIRNDEICQPLFDVLYQQALQSSVYPLE